MLDYNKVDEQIYNYLPMMHNAVCRGKVAQWLVPWSCIDLMQYK